MDKTSCFLDALNGKNDQPPPVWFMRQAGRYLPSYQALKKQHHLLKLFKTPMLAKQITLLPFHDLDLDAGIIFSDILVVFEALGFQIDYPDQKPPHVEAPLDLDDLLKQIKQHDVGERLSYVFESIRLVKCELKKPLLGFSATPFTLLSYLIERPMDESLKKLKTLLYLEPKKIHILLEILTSVVIDYAKRQFEEKIDAFQLFDTASTWLSDEAFLQFSAFYTEKILTALKGHKVIVFTKSALSRAPHYQKMPLSALSVDWTFDYQKLRSSLPSHIGIQGNMDPFLSTLPFSSIEKELDLLLTKVKGDKNFIFNLGHGVLPQTRLDTLQKIIAKIKH